MKQAYAVERVLDHFPGLEADEAARRLRHYSFVSIAGRYLYFEVPKAGCTQMKELLRVIEKAPPLKLFTGRQRETRRDMFIHTRSNVPLPSLVDLDDNTQKQVLESPEFLRMAVVRNPYTRLLSAWRSKVALCEPTARDVYLQAKGRLPDIHNKSLVSFGEFVEYLQTKRDLDTCEPHWRRQIDHMFFPALNFSLVVKLEQLKEGLRRFQQHLGVSDPLTADGRNVSMPVPGAGYTAELAHRVYSLYRPDFEVLGYDRDTWARAKQSPNGQPTNSAAYTEKLLDEIIERNIVISSLYDERERLQAQLRHVSRFHLLDLVNGLAGFRSKLREVGREAEGRARRTLKFRSAANEVQR
jgi:hypothetical protein